MDPATGTNMDDTFERIAKPKKKTAKAKRAKPKAKKKAPAKRAKPKAKKKAPAKRAKSKTKAKPKAKKKAPAKRNMKSPGVVRSERLDMRLSKAEKAKVIAKAKKNGRTVTAIVLEAIGKLR